MSFHITGQSTGLGGFLDFTTYELPAATTIRIPPMCVGTIPHHVSIAERDLDCQLWLVRLPIAFADLNLLVDQGPIPPEDHQDLVTRVFNLSNRQVKIPRGTVISRLVSLKVE